MAQLADKGGGAVGGATGVAVGVTGTLGCDGERESLPPHTVRLIPASAMTTGLRSFWTYECMLYPLPGYSPRAIVVR